MARYPDVPDHAPHLLVAQTMGPFIEKSTGSGPVRSPRARPVEAAPGRHQVAQHMLSICCRHVIHFLGATCPSASATAPEGTWGAAFGAAGRWVSQLARMKHNAPTRSRSGCWSA